MMEGDSALGDMPLPRPTLTWILSSSLSLLDWSPYNAFRLIFSCEFSRRESVLPSRESTNLR